MQTLQKGERSQRPDDPRLLTTPKADREARRLKRMLTVSEATSDYGIKRSKFYQEVAAGRIRLRKCGRRSLVSVDEMEAWAAGLPLAGGQAA